MTESEMEQDGRAAIEPASVQLAFKEAKDLIRSLEGTATSRVNIRAGGLQIEIERGGGVVVAASTAPMAAPAAAPAGAAAAPAAEPGVMAVVAPIVGVFYRSGSPGAKEFVEVGDTVERGQTVCILEAMKVMNQVTTDYRGVVKEILVENGEAVQFEQKLMLIDTGSG